MIICLIEGSPIPRRPITEQLRENTVAGKLRWEGFSEVVTHSTGAEINSDAGIPLKTGSGSRPLHIITIKELLHSDVLKMQLLSEFLQLGTGDYSISELISIEELVWLYDLLPHKVPLFTKFCQRARTYFNEEKPLIVTFWKAFNENNIPEIVKILKEQKSLLFRQFNEFNRFLKVEANAKKKMAHLASRVLIKQQAHAKFKLAALEQEIQEKICDALTEKEKPKIDGLLRDLSERIQRAAIEIEARSCLKKTLISKDKPMKPVTNIICGYLHDPVPA